MTANRCATCGVENPADARTCHVCGEPLLPEDAHELVDILPPLPDGGLADVMPAWLREQPTAAGSAPPASFAPNDPSTFLTPDDLPEWLLRIGEQPAVVVERERRHALSGNRPPPLFLPPAPERPAEILPVAPERVKEEATATRSDLSRAVISPGLAAALILLFLLALAFVLLGPLSR